NSGGIDAIYGGAGDDIIIGGTNNDKLDGGGDRDLVFGDNVHLVRNTGSGDAITPRFRKLTGATIHDVNGALQANPAPTGGPGHHRVTPPLMAPPRGPPAWADWTITLDQSANNSGNDQIAGGAGDDEIFGQLGNDTIEGDGALTLAANPALVSLTNGDDVNGA